MATYTFTTKPRPTEPGQENNFGNMQRDASRYPLSSSEANGMQTTDATATTAQKSPLAITTGTTNIVVPSNAVSVTLCGSAAMSISELSTMDNSFLLPASVPYTFPCANMNNLYVTTASTGNLSFVFNII